MRRLILLAALLAAGPALAQQPHHDAAADHSGHAMQADEASPETDPHAHHRMTRPDEAGIPTAPPPPAALSGPAHAADTVFPAASMAVARARLPKEMGAMTLATVRIDRLEVQPSGGRDGWLWDADLRHGGDIDKLWIKTEGHGATAGGIEDAEAQALWSHAVGPWFDLQAGVRRQIRKGPDRTQLAVGVQGLAPYFFELDAAAFLSTKGEATARVEAEYDQRITQRLILQPRLEAAFSAQDIAELGLGSGLTSLQLGARLRYEIVREVAPYVGVEWQRDIGRTARLTRGAGGDPDRVVLVAGLRLWF